MEIEKKQTVLIMDKIPLVNFLTALCLRLRFKYLTIICLPPEKKIYILKRLLITLLRKRCNIIEVEYSHVDIIGKNHPTELIENFGRLKDDINERSFFVNEELFELKVKNSPGYKMILGYLWEDHRISVYFKKSILLSSCRKLVGLFECSKLIIEKSEYRNKVYISLSADPLGLWDVYKKKYPFQISILQINRVFFQSVERLQTFFLGHIVFLVLVVRFLGRVSRIKKGNGRKKCVIAFSPAFHPYELPLYFKESGNMNTRFSVKKAIVLSDNTDNVANKRFYKKYGIPVVYPKKQPVSFIFFWQRIVIGLGINLYLRNIGELLLLQINVSFWEINYKILRDMFDLENVCEEYEIEFYITQRFYEINNAMKTIVFNRNGGKTASTPFGDASQPMMQTFLYAYIVSNILYLNGKGMASFKRFGHYIDEFHVTGYVSTDLMFRMKDQSHDLRKKYHANEKFVIVIFGPAYNESKARRYHVLKFYDAVLKGFASVMNSNVRFIIKSHYKEYDMEYGETDFPELKELLDPFKENGKFSIFYREDPYELMTIADLVACWSFSTSGIESITAGKKTFYIDPMRSRFNPYMRYHEDIVVDTPEKVCDLFQKSLEGNFPISEKVYDHIRSKHTYSFDGLAMQRKLSKLSSLKRC
ncbi:MAG: hypothetical protein ACE5GU_06135 [Candidatus Scalinduaceae bacterium]